MATPLIITKSDFVGRIELPNTLGSEKYTQHITHAEDFDLCKLMGNEFFYYFISFFEANGIIKNDAPQPIKDLYNGSTYAVDEVNYSNPGVKPVLVYFAGARLIKGIGNHITPNSFATKVSEFSEPVSKSTMLFQATEYENQAIAYWNKCLLFMSNNKENYHNFYGDCGCSDSRSGKRATRVAVGGCDYSDRYYSKRDRRWIKE